MSPYAADPFCPRDSRSPRCSCIEDAESARQQIMRVYETWLDAIVIMGRQVNEFSLRYAACQERHDTFRGDMTLVDIYTRLLDLLEAAVSKYQMPSLSSSVSTAPTPQHGSTWLLHGEAGMTRRDSSVSSMLPGSGSEEPQPPSNSALPADAKPSCMPVPMTWGEYQLDEDQSSLVALEVISRILRSSVASLKGMQGTEAIRSDELASKALRLLGTCSASLAIWS